jgi:hypothetical protein
VNQMEVQVIENSKDIGNTIHREEMGKAGICTEGECPGVLHYGRQLGAVGRASDDGTAQGLPWSSPQEK